MRSGSFVVRVPHADYRAFSVHTTALDGALLVWCGAARGLEAVSYTHLRAHET